MEVEESTDRKCTSKSMVRRAQSVANRTEVETRKVRGRIQSNRGNGRQRDRRQQGVCAISSGGSFPCNGRDDDTARERTPVIGVGTRNEISNIAESGECGADKVSFLFR